MSHPDPERVQSSQELRQLIDKFDLDRNMPPEKALELRELVAALRKREQEEERQRQEEQMRADRQEQEEQERVERETSKTQADTQTSESQKAPLDRTDPFGEVAGSAVHADDRIAGKPTSSGASPSHAGTVENTTSIRFEGPDGVTGKTDADVSERSAQSSTDRDSSSDTDTDHTDGDLARDVDRDELSESVSLSGAMEHSDQDYEPEDRKAEFG